MQAGTDRRGPLSDEQKDATPHKAKQQEQQGAKEGVEESVAQRHLSMFVLSSVCPSSLASLSTPPSVRIVIFICSIQPAVNSSSVPHAPTRSIPIQRTRRDAPDAAVCSPIRRVRTTTREPHNITHAQRTAKKSNSEVYDKSSLVGWMIRVCWVGDLNMAIRITLHSGRLQFEFLSLLSPPFPSSRKIHCSRNIAGLISSPPRAFGDRLARLLTASCAALVALVCVVALFVVC